MPVNRQGYDCPLFPAEVDEGAPGSSGDSCMGEEGLAAWPMNLAMGVRVVPPVRGLSVVVALDLGLTGTSTFVHELAPNAPFTLMVSLGYDYDARPQRPMVLEVPVPAPPPPPRGRVTGVVNGDKSGAPIAGRNGTPGGSRRQSPHHGR